MRLNLPAIVGGLALLTVWIASGCSQPLVRHPAEAVVEESYLALSRDDMDAYMDTILPENRQIPNPLMLLKGLAIYGGVGGVQVGLDLEQLSTVSLREMQFTAIQVDDDYALVQASGFARYPALVWELAFCDQHDVRRVDGKWYIDVYAPEREVRLQHVLDQRLQELEAYPPGAEDLAGLLESVGEASKLMLDLCPR